MGVQVELAGPLGLMRAHQLPTMRSACRPAMIFAPRQFVLRKDAWWQLNCDLVLTNPPKIAIEQRVAGDRYYRFLEATWTWQQLPPALLLYAMGGWSFVAFGTCARVTAGVLGTG